MSHSDSEESAPAEEQVAEEVVAEEEEGSDVIDSDALETEDEPASEIEEDEESEEEESPPIDEEASTSTVASAKVGESRFIGDPIAKESMEELIVIPDSERRTSHIMSTFEMTEAISIRSEQIAKEGLSGSMLDKMPPLATCARDIAIAELRARRCPLKLLRQVGSLVVNGTIKTYVEIWSPNEMSLPLQ